jgi:hypothetical protein
MAKVKPSLIEYSGTIGREIHYTRFGRTYSRRLPTEYNDRKSEAQLRQRALFKARQKTSALFGTILQRGLTKEAHSEGMTEANYFSRLNKDCFMYEGGVVRIDYPALLVGRGPLPEVNFTRCRAEGIHVEVSFTPFLEDSKAVSDDVVHIYAVEPQVEICQLVASVWRRDGQASFDLPDLSEESDVPLTFYLYAIVESASTAGIPTLSAAEKQRNKKHRNINRRVSRSVFVGTVIINQHSGNGKKQIL